MDFATTNFRYVRVIEGTPARNVSRCVGIGIGGKPARLARELIACGPVLLTDTAAGRMVECAARRLRIYSRASLSRTLGVSDRRRQPRKERYEPRPIENGRGSAG